MVPRRVAGSRIAGVPFVIISIKAGAACGTHLSPPIKSHQRSLDPHCPAEERRACFLQLLSPNDSHPSGQRKACLYICLKTKQIASACLGSEHVRHQAAASSEARYSLGVIRSRL